jgi:hypothetical protein
VSTRPDTHDPAQGDRISPARAVRIASPQGSTERQRSEDERPAVEGEPRLSSEVSAGENPRGILRRPRERFPEDPNPVREGVAPLRQHNDVPQGARWTRIDRRLVDPEALIEGNERFEERPDVVVVLRVLSKEEIEAYAMLTREIRGKHADELRPR